MRDEPAIQALMHIDWRRLARDNMCEHGGLDRAAQVQRPRQDLVWGRARAARQPADRKGGIRLTLLRGYVRKSHIQKTEVTWRPGQSFRSGNEKR